MRWPPNPYAIAQRLSGRVLVARDGKTADEFLKAALLNDKARTQLERVGVKTIDDALRFFRKVSALSEEPIPIAKARAFPLVQAASDAYGADAIDKLLPFLLPISDAEFDRAEPTVPDLQLILRGVAYADTGPLVVNEVQYLDPRQGDALDCYLIAAMIALAWTEPARVNTLLRASGYRPPERRSFEWRFQEQDESRETRVAVSGSVPFEGGVPRYAKSDPIGEFWPSLVEKAYLIRVKTRRQEPIEDQPRPADYHLIAEHTQPWIACQQLAGGASDFDLHFSDLHGQVLSRPELFNEAGKAIVPLMAVTAEEIEGHDQTWSDFGLQEDHAYAVLGKMRESDHVVLRNPYGFSTDVKEGHFDGSTWDCGEQEPIALNQSGVFAITREMFNKCFRLAGWVKF